MIICCILLKRFQDCIPEFNKKKSELFQSTIISKKEEDYFKLPLLNPSTGNFPSAITFLYRSCLAIEKASGAIPTVHATIANDHSLFKLHEDSKHEQGVPALFHLYKLVVQF